MIRRVTGGFSHPVNFSRSRRSVVVWSFCRARKGRPSLIRVQSLKSTIIVHLAAILLPLVALFVFESTEDARRTSDVDRHFRLHGLALEAKERYTAFGNGAADAVDTSELSLPALIALRDARDRTAELARATRLPELDGVAGELGAIAEALDRDRRLPSLLALRERIVAQREPIKRAQADQEARLNESFLFY